MVITLVSPCFHAKQLQYYWLYALGCILYIIYIIYTYNIYNIYIFLWLIYFIMWSLNLLITLTCVNLKKNEQYQSCTLSFIWSKMRTAAQATVPQTALRNCCLEGKLVCLWFWWRQGTCNHAHTFFQKVSACERSGCYHEGV